MLLADSRSMREADRLAIDRRGIPSTLLMTNAANAVAAAAMDCFSEKNGYACIFCGTGNNGGDGIAAGCRLLCSGVQVRVFLVGNREKMTPDAREMARRLRELGGELEDFSLTESMEAAVRNATVLIDALFGIGLSRPVSGQALEAIELMNASGVPIISVDIASGVDADTGKILGEAVQAEKTVTFSMAKPGHFTAPGCTCCGRLEIRQIGIPPEMLQGCGVSAITREDVRIPPRPPLAHKGDFGKLLVIGGSVGYTGAPTLCAKSALRTGAGLVSLGVPQSIYEITAVKNDEAMPFPLADDGSGKLAQDAAEVILSRAEGADAAVVGPGLGRSDAMAGLIRRLAEESRCNLVFDADALFALAQNCDILKNTARPAVLTPHEGEFSRFSTQHTGDRIADARAFAVNYGCALVLKGHATVCAFPDGDVWINTTGDPALAKGGSGDVLAGIVGALLCRMPLKAAVTAAVWIHGSAGDRCAETLGENGVLASDLIRELPRILRDLEIKQ